VEKTYPIRVRFPNASGLIKGADVLLSGARIGSVAGNPALTGEKYEVEVVLNIREVVRIPRVAAFQIRTSGLMGDAYVDVVVPVKFDPNDNAQAGDLVAGQRTTGIEDLEKKGTEMIDTVNTEILRKLSGELDELKATTVNINEQLLSKKNLDNLDATLANMKASTEEFSKASKDLDLAFMKTQETVDAAKETLKTVNGAAGDLRLTIGDFRKVADSAHGLLNKAETGDGALGTLISDKQTADNLKALIANMRRSGVVFYKDRPLPAGESSSSPTPTPKHR
jgi:ABC-type transporter Mla subunit MlaD